MRKTAVFASDKNHDPYVATAMLSFRRHNPSWRVVHLDVEGDSGNVREWCFAGLADEVRKCRREPRRGPRMHTPAVYAKLAAMRELAGEDSLFLWVDADTVTLASVDPMVDRFLGSGMPIGMWAETDERFWHDPAGRQWFDDEVPADLFPRRDEWAGLPALNTGVLLATGEAPVRVAAACEAVYERCWQSLNTGDQAIIASMAYELGVGVHRLATHEHCCLWEGHLEKTGRPYVDPVLIDGVPVVVRHWSSQDNRGHLNDLWPDLREAYRADRYYMP